MAPASECIGQAAAEILGQAIQGPELRDACRGLTVVIGLVAHGVFLRVQIGMGREQTLEGARLRGHCRPARQGGGEFTGRCGPEIGGSPERAPEGEGQSLVPGKGREGRGSGPRSPPPAAAKGFPG